MGGLIRGFLGGAGQAANDAGKMLLMDKLNRERDEANALKSGALAGKEREYRTTEREAGQEFSSGEAEKERTSREKVAGAKTDKPIYKTLKNEYGEEKLVEVDPESGSYTVVKEAGAGIDVEKVEPTTGDIQSAIDKYEKTASWTKSDEAQFGMSESEFKKKYAKEMAVERTKKEQGTGMIGKNMPSLESKQEAPKQAIDYLKTNPDALPMFIKKYGYDPTK